MNELVTKMAAGRLAIAASEFVRIVQQHYTADFATQSLRLLADAIEDRIYRDMKAKQYIQMDKRIEENRQATILGERVYIKSRDQMVEAAHSDTLPTWEMVVEALRLLHDKHHIPFVKISEMIGVGRNAVKAYYNGKKPRQMMSTIGVRQQILKHFETNGDLSELRIRYNMLISAQKGISPTRKGLGNGRLKK